MSQLPVVAIIGAGPAGIYAAEQLLKNNCAVVLFNRDIKPGGLAEYGIFFDKHKMKDGLRRQFQHIFENPNLIYYGNVTVGEEGDLTMRQLRQWGFSAILVTVGAQGTKWLGLPGEQLKGVYHAKDLVYHYNKLPPYSEQNYMIGKRVAVIGAGNVMLDMANYLIRYVKVEQFIAVVRRDPSAVKFTKKEMQTVAANLDLEALEAEFARTKPIMESAEVDPKKAKEFILSALPKATPPVSDSRFLFDFLAAPKSIWGDGQGKVAALEIEDTTLELRDGVTRSRNLGTTRLLPVDTVIFAIGDRVDTHLGLPTAGNEFAKNPTPLFPVDGISYEAFDPVANHSIDGVFVAGWARSASSGLVGIARKDGTNGATAILNYLASAEPSSHDLPTLDQLIKVFLPDAVGKDELATLAAYEEKKSAELGVEEYKLASNQAMLQVIHADA